MDLNTLEPKTDDIEIAIKHPVSEEPVLNDDDTPMYVKVWAPHSKAYKSAMYKQANQRIKMRAEEFDAESLETAGLEFLAAITKDWSITFDGKQPKLTEAKAKEVYDRLFWLKNQVEAEVNSFEVFTKA